MPSSKTVHLAATALISLVMAGALLPGARADDAARREALIVVTGEGEAATAPDMAVVGLSVVREAKTARAALDDNNKAMGDVLAALKADGLADRDLQTSGFGIAPQYSYPVDKDGQSLPPELVGYQVTNALTVRLRDLNKLGALLDTAVSLGVNQGGDIRFTNDKPDATIAEARKAAMAMAVAKAKTLTEAAGVRLGRIIEISETSNRPEPMPMYRAAVAKEMSDSAAVPVASGENSYSVSVNVTFAIDQ